MIFTTTRELLLNHLSPFLFVCGERPPGYAVDLINVGVPGVPSAWERDVSRYGTYDEPMVNSNSHSEGLPLIEE